MSRVIEIIERPDNETAVVRSLIAFPSADFVSGLPRHRHIQGVVLLRLQDATIWQLAIPGLGWSREQLDRAANILADVSAEPFTIRSIGRVLRQGLQIDGLSVIRPLLDRVDPDVWEIDKVAFALVRRPDAKELHQGVSETRPEDSEWDVRQALREELTEALRRFGSNMDSRALRLASSTGHFDQRVYNYLVYARHRHYRLQFADTFPSLLQTAVVAEPAGFGAELRTIVDTGTPLIKGLAARWNVRPGVIRHLVGRASANVGFRWSRDAKGLALALDALHAQDVPGDTRGEWGEFNRIVATGQRLFLQPISESAAGQTWLRQCLRLSRRGDKKALARWRPEWNDLEEIVRFRKALATALAEEDTDNRASSGTDSERAFANAVDHVMLRIAEVGLQDVAANFSEALARARQEDMIRQARQFEALMPLCPDDFITADGTMRFRSLCTERELYAHGTRMSNCLRSSSVRSITLRGKPGTVFIVGVYDTDSDMALSTVELKALTDRTRTSYRLIVNQHTAKANRKPSSRCARALAEFIRFCYTRDVREHLSASWKSLRDPGESDSQLRINLPGALRRALGERTYDSLFPPARVDETNRTAGRQAELPYSG